MYMQVLKSDVEKWANDIRHDAYLCMDDYIKNVIIKNKDMSDEAKIKNLKSYYNKFNQDLLEADTIEELWYFVCKVLNDEANDLVEICKNRDYVQFLSYFKHFDSESRFINCVMDDDINNLFEIMGIIKNLKNDYPYYVAIKED